uniref:DUF4794 domain-containing protein n=1 Tax=Stomoxys calcitrans TaxID=35570 RepID=A0A1I8QA35_STOCA
MLANMKGTLREFFWLMALISSICLANGRQIRYSRYATEITEDNVHDYHIVGPFEVEATVREIKLAPYAAAGFRPAKAFPLPNEKQNENVDDNNESVTDVSSTTIANGGDSLSLATITSTTEGFVGVEATTTATSNNAEDSIVVYNAEAPYPANGFRPKIPFNLPNELSDRSQRAEEPITESSTTAIAEEGGLDTSQGAELATGEPITESSTTAIEEEATTTELSTAVPLAEFTTRMPEIEAKAPYPAAGFRPRIPFNLPSDNQVKDLEPKEPTNTDTPPNQVAEEESLPQAPYPAAGFRPSKAFLLPNEQLNNDDQQPQDNSKHPVCGSSTNPLAPKPLDGEMKDPDAETIFVNPKTVIVPVRTAAQPLILARPFFYMTHIQAW